MVFPRLPVVLCVPAGVRWVSEALETRALIMAGFLLGNALNIARFAELVLNAASFVIVCARLLSLFEGASFNIKAGHACQQQK